MRPRSLLERDGKMWVEPPIRSAMRWESLSRNDFLELKLYLATDPSAAGVEGIRPLLDGLQEGECPPEKFRSGKKESRLSIEALAKCLEKRRPDRTLVIDFLRESPPEMSGYVGLAGAGREVRLGLTLTLKIALSHFQDSRRGAERSRTIAKLFAALTRADNPKYGLAHASADFSLGSDPHQSDPYAPYAIYEIYWLNVYGKEMVESIGRERVLSTPADHLEQLPEGGVLFTTGPTPADFSSDEARRAQARALAHLRDDVTFEQALARLRERDEILRPVEPDWDPDIADLIALVLDDLPFARRQPEIARFNRYRPPPVTEWRPAADGLPPDAPNPRAAIAEYQTYAEKFRALLHREARETARAVPEVLPRIDHYFWQANYPATFNRADIQSDLVPAIGALLGELLVERLGGRWVPRRNLDETEVVLGDRAWLPFLRARHYMQSKQSVLDHSLTQFFRVAARHAADSRFNPHFPIAFE